MIFESSAPFCFVNFISRFALDIFCFFVIEYFRLRVAVRQTNLESNLEKI